MPFSHCASKYDGEVTSPDTRSAEFDGLVSGRAGTTTGSRLDAWWARLMSTPLRRRLYNWGAPAIVLVVASVTRLWNLGSPHTLVFDETFYVKDSWTLWNLG